MLTCAKGWASGVVAAACVATTTSVASTTATVASRATGLNGTGHSAGRLRPAGHCWPRRTERSTGASAHGGLLLTSLRLSNPLSKFWIRRNDRAAGLGLGLVKALTTALHRRTSLLRPRHRRSAGSNTRTVAGERLIGLWAWHRHARSTSTDRRWRARSRSATLRRNDLTRSRREGNALRGARKLGCGRSRWSRAERSARSNLRRRSQSRTGPWSMRAGGHTGARGDLHRRCILNRS